MPSFPLPGFARSHDEPAAPAVIHEIQSILGCVLPDDYMNFLLVHNGVYVAIPDDDVGAAVAVDWSAYPTNEVKGFDRHFFIATIWDVENVLNEVQQYHVWGDQSFSCLPKRYLPISHDNGGADYVMDISDGPGRGSIYLWPVNLHHPWGHERNRHMGRVAESFTDFLHAKIVAPPLSWR